MGIQAWHLMNQGTWHMIRLLLMAGLHAYVGRACHERTLTVLCHSATSTVLQERL